MRPQILTKTLVSVTLLIASIGAAAARDTLSIVGSSTVYPFATAVSSHFAQAGHTPPRIESTGSGSGFKLFCAGVGEQYPDITNASRRMKASELETCMQNGVKEVVEIRIGYDGIVIANMTKSNTLDLTARDLFLALAREIPNPNGSETLVLNPYRSWKQVNAKLPDQPIEVLGPPPTSGTRDAFNELALEAGCNSYPWIKALAKSDKDKHKAICSGLRADGAFVEAGENDDIIVKRLKRSPNALGIFGYSFLEKNHDTLHGALFNSVPPTFDRIASGEYGLSRPLFFYVKKAHLPGVSGLADYVAEFAKESTWGSDGYLKAIGLIPAPTAERDAAARTARELPVLRIEDL